MTEAGPQRRDALSAGTVLRDYTLESVIGHGGFGIVYRARHDELDLTVAVKEYLPVELAVREGSAVRPRSGTVSRDFEDGLRRFRDEARALIAVRNHASIVSCRDFFRANGTAYLVMEHEDGVPLDKLLASREAEGEPFGERDLLAVMVPLVQGLAIVHKAGILHRDIKPSNILIRSGNEQPVLIDFGAAKQVVAKHTKSLAPYTEGYAALEQVADAGELGPWTDMYGVGALMWRIVAGGRRPWEPPNPLSVERRSHAALGGQRDPLPAARELGKGRFKPSLLSVIDRCLRLPEAERVQSCRVLLDVLGDDRNSDAAGPVSVASATPVGTGKSTNNPRAWKVALAALVAVLGLSFVVPQWWSLATKERSASVNVDASESSRPRDKVEAISQVASRTDRGELIQGEGTPSSNPSRQQPTDVSESVEASGSTQFEGSHSNEAGSLDLDDRSQSPEDQSVVPDRADIGTGTTGAAAESTLGGAQGEEGQRVESPSHAESSVPTTEFRTDRQHESVLQRVESVTKTGVDSQGEEIPTSTSGSQRPTDVSVAAEASGSTQSEADHGNETGNLDSDTRPRSPEDPSAVPDRADRGGEATAESTLGGAQGEIGQRLELPSHAKPSAPDTEAKSNRRPESAEQRIEPVAKSDAESQGSRNSRPQTQRRHSRYWTEGSHENEVLRIQGTPKGVSKYPNSGKEVWTYGFSSVEFDIRTRRVLEWSNLDGNLRVELQPGREGTGARHWTEGSHEDEVLRIQGTPKGVSKYPSSGTEVWTYGFSSVEFDIRTRRVLEWSNLDGNLRVELQPGREGTGARHWTVGSHEDDVLRIQGTPKRVSKYPSSGTEVWTYGFSSVEFDIRTRRVLEWSNLDGNLRVELQPGREGTGARHWTVGSHEDDVLRIQGTPKRVSKYPSSGTEVWTYGFSSVEFDIRTRRVLEWSNLDGNLRVRR